MICPRCQTRAADGSKFCGECGFNLLSALPQPVAVAPAGARRRRAAERRQLTVMFYDLVGSTALAGRCDPEDFSDAMDGFHAAVEAAVESFGGFVGSRVGDGAAVYFGYPHALEDAAERAVLAGLRAVEATAEIILPDGSLARIRVGIATGQSVVSDLAEGESGNEVVGTVANLAARLQSAAPPGTVVIAQSTRRLIGELFRLQDLGTVEAKGFDAPVAAWRVLAAAATDRFAALRATDAAPLIGRGSEFERLQAAWRAVAAGSPRVMLIIGEPGVGKSRLTADFVTWLHDEQAYRVKLFCAPHSQQTPLRPSIDNLRRIMARGRNGLADVLPPSIDADDIALLNRLAGLPDELTPALRRLAPAQLLDRTIDALIHQTEHMARSNPMCLLFEDVHWADPTTLTMIDRAVRTQGLGRTLLITTARPEFLPGWVREPGVDTVSLSPLGAADGASLIDRIAGAGKLAAGVRAAILKRGDGVPLFLEELTRSVIESDARVGPGGDAELDLPATLQDSLLARLDRLGPAKEIAQVGAVIGREFSAQLIATLTEQPASEQESSLERLVASGLVLEYGAPDARQFQFKHVLVQQTAYGTLLRAERRRLNSRLVAALEAEFSSVAETEPERMAHYATEAGLREAAASYWYKAGVQALQQSAMPEAIGRLRRGLAIIAQQPHGAARWRQELDLELALGKALIATQGYAAASTGEAFQRARVLCQAIDEQPNHLSVIYGLWLHDFICGRLTAAIGHVDELLAFAKAQSDDVWTMIGCRARGVLAYPLGKFQESYDNLVHGLSLYDPTRRAEYARIMLDDIGVVTRVYCSWLLVHLGRAEESRAQCERAVADARAIDHPMSMAHALNGRLLVRCWTEDFSDFETLYAELDRLCLDNGIVFFRSTAEIVRGRYLDGIGRHREACRTFERAIKAYRATESVIYLTTFMTWHADAMLHDARGAEALALLDEVRALAQATGMSMEVANTCRVEGDIHRDHGDLTRARACYAEALEVATRQGVVLFGDRARRRLAALDSDAAHRPAVLAAAQ